MNLQDYRLYCCGVAKPATAIKYLYKALKGMFLFTHA